VQTGQKGTFVFTIDDQNKAVMRPVTAGRTIANRTVIEQGVKVGERIVTDGMGKLAPGSKVAIKESPPVKEGEKPRSVDARGGTAP